MRNWYSHGGGARPLSSPAPWRASSVLSTGAPGLGGGGGAGGASWGGEVQPSGTLRAIWPCSIAAPMPVLHRATNAHTMYMRARMYNPVTLPALTAARRSPLYLRGVRQRKGVLPPVDRCWQLCRTTRRAETEEGLTPKIARIQYFCFRIVPDWSEGQISLGTPDLKTPCSPRVAPWVCVMLESNNGEWLFLGFSYDF